MGQKKLKKLWVTEEFYDWIEERKRNMEKLMKEFGKPIRVPKLRVMEVITKTLNDGIEIDERILKRILENKRRKRK